MTMIYFDLDDVAADFSGYVNKVTGSNYKIGDSLLLDHWEELRRNHQRMFADLEVVEPVRRLISDLFGTGHGDKIRFLTAIPFDGIHPWQYATLDKFQWVDKNFGGIPLFIGPYAHDKYKHCKRDDILIDDKGSNCDEWLMANGRAHEFRNVDSCRIWLARNLTFGRS